MNNSTTKTNKQKQNENLYVVTVCGMGNPDREIGWTEDAAVIAAYLRVIEHKD